MFISLENAQKFEIKVKKISSKKETQQVVLSPYYCREARSDDKVAAH
jgi:hypothetical protein